LQIFSAEKREAVVNLRPLLAQICETWSLSTAEKSLLTPNGFPLEFAFATNSEDICVTAEIGNSAWSHFEKRQFIDSICNDSDIWNDALMKELINQTNQRFGLWLSIRQADFSRRFKIYQEVTNHSAKEFLAKLRFQIGGDWKDEMLDPRLYGIVPQNNEIKEFYCKIIQPDFQILHKLFAAAGKAKMLPFVVNYLAFLADEESKKLLKRLRLGVSFQISPNDSPELTLFAHSAQLFSDNLKARKKILEIARQFDVEMRFYERASSQINESFPAELVHGMIGIKIKESEFDCIIGVEPFSVKSNESANRRAVSARTKSISAA
ncbi:MAG TPA: hypothetical protein PKY59_09440, partial [Pyrinomonadaceae bacterium]|nr:hypothetical protein [Pyrinomonadaceae bacterium]